MGVHDCGKSTIPSITYLEDLYKAETLYPCTGHSMFDRPGGGVTQENATKERSKRLIGLYPQYQALQVTPIAAQRSGCPNDQTAR